MEIKLNEEETLRINAEYSRLSNFIDIGKAGYSGLYTTFFAGFQYIEIRRKGDVLRAYTFPKKSHKKEYDFGHWDDADVVFSLNEQIMHKD